jgi:hypothetical protein
MANCTVRKIELSARYPTLAPQHWTESVSLSETGGAYQAGRRLHVASMVGEPCAHGVGQFLAGYPTSKGEFGGL